MCSLIKLQHYTVCWGSNRNQFTSTKRWMTLDQRGPLKHFKTKSNMTRKKVPTCKLVDFFDLPGEMTFLITLKLIHFASTSIFYWASIGGKNVCRQMFSTGNVWRRTFLWEYANILYSGITVPANLLFRLDKVLHGSTSALISNSPFLTFILVSSRGVRKKKKKSTRETVGRETVRVKTRKVTERRLPRTTNFLKKPQTGVRGGGSSAPSEVNRQGSGRGKQKPNNRRLYSQRSIRTSYPT